MGERPVKTYPTLGCCGLDCGLCPRYYTVGTSRCPGCSGPGFFDKHPSCGYITCCVKKKGLEVCAQCDEFPCSRFASRSVSAGEYDSVLTYKKVRPNLESIRVYGLEPFIERQRKRIRLLEKMLEGFDDGRSRSFYCIAATLIPIDDLEASLAEAERGVKADGVAAEDVRTKAGVLRELLQGCAGRRGVELKLRKKRE